MGTTQTSCAPVRLTEWMEGYMIAAIKSSSKRHKELKLIGVECPCHEIERMFSEVMRAAGVIGALGGSGGGGRQCVCMHGSLQVYCCTRHK